MTSTMRRASGKRGPQPYLPSRWVALALLASAQLMLVLDITVVNVALPVPCLVNVAPALLLNTLVPASP